MLYLFIRGLYGLYTLQIKNYKTSRDLDNLKYYQLSANSSTKRILKLYDIMKKQTILVCIAGTISISFWTSCVICNIIKFDGSDLTEELMCWIITIECICICLMFNYTNSYWKCCMKYGCCCICYRN